MEPGLLRDLLTVLLGLLTGIMSAAFGIGGAVISTPGVRLLGASALVAVGTTLPSILPGAVAGTARYWREGLVDWRVVAITASAGVAAAVLGSLASHEVPGEGHWLMVATAGMLGFTAVRLVRTAEPARDEADEEPGAEAPAASEAAAAPDDETRPRRSLPILLGVGAAAGLLSGLLGVGGGVVLLPAFLEVVRLPTKEAVATSLACVGLLAIPSTITHAYLGDIDWRFAGLLAVAVVPGARLGAMATMAMSDRRLRLTVGILLGALSLAYGVSELRSALT